MEVKCICCGKDEATPKYIVALIPEKHLYNYVFDSMAPDLCENCYKSIHNKNLGKNCKTAQEIIDKQIIQIRKQKLKKLLS